MKFLRILFIFLVAVFVLAQFFPIDKTNPEFDTKNDLIVMENPPADIAQVLKSACYDCHSNETVWPWYSNIAPISFVVEKHVIEGRDNLNFSFWGEFDQEDKSYVVEEMIEEIEEGDMPFPGYDMAHPDAKLTDKQKEKLFAWLRSLQ